jgi:hypothetical protein
LAEEDIICPIDAAVKRRISHGVPPNTTAMILPRNYVERFPRRPAWTPAAEPPPSYAFTTQVLLENGGTTSAVWTGEMWWGLGAEQRPIGWRWVENSAMSHGSKEAAPP